MGDSAFNGIKSRSLTLKILKFIEKDFREVARERDQVQPPPQLAKHIRKSPKRIPCHEKVERPVQGLWNSLARLQKLSKLSFDLWTF